MENILIDREGFKWIARDERFYNNSNQDALAANINHEFKTLELIRKFTGAKFFLDIGSHTGYYSIRLSKTIPNIIAFEMIPSNYEALLRNIELNELKNVLALNIGLWNEHEQGIAFDRGMESYLQNAFDNKTEPGLYFNRHEVLLCPLDDVLETFGLNNIIEDATIKIDTDGADYQIMQGATKLLNIENSAWIVEHHARMFSGDRKQAIIDLLFSHGFNKFHDINEYEMIASKGFFTEQLEKIIQEGEVKDEN